MKWNVLVTRRLPGGALGHLEQHCHRVRINPEDRLMTRDELLAGVPGMDGILCLLTDVVDREILDAADRAGIFANYAVGFNNIDVEEATRRGILITNTPGVLTEATADLTWALIMSVARRVPESDRFTREGRFQGWGPGLLLGADVTGKTLGIVGAGRIGSAVALRSAGFGMRVLYCDPNPNSGLEKRTGASRVNLDTLLGQSDFITLHVALTPETRHLIGAEELARMKPSSFLINTSRGPVVDEVALVTALKSGEIAGAGLDVYEEEPDLAPGLAELPNTVLLPHTGSATEATRSRMADMAVENLLAGLRGEIPPNLVNPQALKARN
jgi:lactate dehydrogenase-like 2-hydroxyacid dehydrogenase